MTEIEMFDEFHISLSSLSSFYLFQKCVVDLPGGPLEIEWSTEDNRIYMTGPAEAVFSGSAFL